MPDESGKNIEGEFHHFPDSRPDMCIFCIAARQLYSPRRRAFVLRCMTPMRERLENVLLLCRRSAPRAHVIQTYDPGTWTWLRPCEGRWVWVLR